MAIEQQVAVALAEPEEAAGNGHPSIVRAHGLLRPSRWRSSTPR